ncbi:cadherin-like and PC-esterase domain-containing protein 1 [Mytilus edulis]|uniref:cadherin-like and PC-esterase domain-containing protein 1 n=1 Tax=Mytilus edulis TaxID=6550 RepID=UPI0039EE9306
MSACLSKSTLRQTFLWMIVVACLSSLVTYHIGLLLPWVEMNQASDQVQQHVRMNRMLMKEVNSQETSGIDDRIYERDGRQNSLRKLSVNHHQSTQSSTILAKLRQIESRLQSISAYRTVLTLGLTKNQTQVIKDVFSKHYYTLFTKDETTDTKGNWSVVWTASKTDIENRNDAFTKYNHIPVLHQVMEHPEYICYLHTVYSKITERHNATCYDKLPTLKKKKSSYILYDEKKGIQTNHGTDARDIRYKGRLWHSDSSLLRNNGTIIHMKLNVYVAAMFPVRLYIYSGKELEEMKTYISDSFGETLEAIWWTNLKRSVVLSLLTSENLALKQNLQHNYIYNQYTQLLQYHVVFTSNFQPIILKMKPLTQSESFDIVKDTVSLMITKETVSMDVSVALSESSSGIILDQKKCRNGFGVCLLESDLIYLLNSAKESKSLGNFIKIYPSLSDDYTIDITKLQQIWMNDRSLQTLNQQIKDHHIPEFHSTADVHSLLHQVESHLSAEVDYVEEDLLRSNLVPHSNFRRHLKSSDQKDYILSDEEGSTLLSHLEVYPTIDLQLDPYKMNYNITVNYDIIMLQFDVRTKDSKTEARFENISGLVRRSNFTIGLGDNLIKILVVDISKRQPVIINTYTFNVYRKYGGQTGISSTVLKTCVLKQDCTLKFLPDQSCGLQPSAQYTTWNQFILESNKKPYCYNYQDSLDADWKVPCYSCADRESCYWQQARWQPSSCQHRKHSITEVKKCFVGKKFLFIGDSTNRGIMHYILEKINGTLYDWDKTHDLKFYTSVNNQQTLMSFAYYPQFWLPNNHRPGFDKAVYQLIKWTSPLENNSNTVLVVGGVHWLGKQHINVIWKALKREGLTGIKLIMKGHGAGFHQHVEGVHFASQNHQEKLEIQEKEVGRYASNHGFHVIPTFNMTMSRYKDFLQGKCACHFHKVTTTTNRQGLKQYHIEGDINAAYSELMINAICQRHPG